MTNRKKLQLDTSVADRPSLPRSTSSEDSALSSADTDTASGGSPAPPAPAPAPVADAAQPRRTRKDEYDSSATETADEENDTPTAKVPTLILLLIFCKNMIYSMPMSEKLKNKIG